MILSRINLDGFGVLVDQEFEFQPGFNLILGPNEAGKSTLQQAILALLFGFYTRPRLSSKEKYIHESFRPWRSKKYSGKLYLRLDNGNTFLITRKFDFPEPETQIFDTRTGHEITQQFTQRRRGFIDFSERTIGMARSVFEAIACVKQGQLTRLSENEAQNISDSILRLVDSGSADVSVRTALDRISTAIRFYGTDRSRSGPIYDLKAALHEAEQHLHERNSLNQLLESDYLRIQTIQREIHRLQQREQDVENDIQRTELSYLQKLLKRHAELADRKQELENQLANLRDQVRIPLSNRDIIIKLLEERKILRQERQRLYEEQRHFHEEQRKARLDLDNLPPNQDFWPGAKFNDFFILQHRWEKIHHKVDEIQTAQKNLKAKFAEIGIDEEKEEQLKVIHSEDIEDRQKQASQLKERQLAIDSDSKEIARRRRYFNYGRIFVGIVLFSLFIISIASQFPFDASASPGPNANWLHALTYIAVALALIWLIVELAFAITTRLWQENLSQEQQILRLEEKELQEFFEPFGVSQIDDLLLLLQRYGEIRNLHAQEITQIDEMKDIEDSLLPWLQAFQLTRITPENLRRISEMVRQGMQLREYLHELKTKIREIEIELAARDARLEEIFERLKSIFQAANCWTGNIDQDAQQFFTAMEKMQKYDKLMQDWDQLSALEQEMLAGKTVDQLYERQQILEESLADQSPPTNLPPQKELKKLLDEVQLQKQQLQVELAGLQERIAERESKLPDLSEIEEAIASYQRKLQDLTLRRQALELAYEALSEVAQQAHGDFAPEIARSVGEQLARLTENRYQEAYIDPSSFSIRIAHGAARTLIPLNQLSFGTQEQIYLLMRSAVAQLFSKNGERIPLFLDDPLAHADEKRQYNMLALLIQLAQSQQLFYFTKDQSIVDTLAVFRTEYNLITLTPDESMAPFRWAAGTAKHLNENGEKDSKSEMDETL